MNKTLDVKQLCIETCSFIMKNWFLLLFFGFISFIASFLSFKYVFKHHMTMLYLYGLFCYFFYYVFISLYFEQKPVFTSEKLVNSVVKAVIVFALSLFVVICGHLSLKLLKYMAQTLIGFPDIYEMLKNTYHFLNASKFGQWLLYIPVIFLLTFTFFIPGFAWISTLNGGDSSLWSAYERTHGNYFKISIVLFFLYAILPFVLSFIFLSTPFYLSVLHAFVSIIQLVFYVHLYDFFYSQSLEN